LNPFSPIILIEWLNNNHFALLIPTNYFLFNDINDSNDNDKTDDYTQNKIYKQNIPSEIDSNLLETIEEVKFKK